MRLSDLLTKLCAEVVIERITSEQYSRAERRLSEHLGRDATIDDLQTDTINSYLVWLKSQYDISNTTLRNYRSAIIRVWNYASDRYDHTPCVPRRIRSPKKDAVVVRAWTLPELRILMQAAEHLPGSLKCGIPAKVFMSAWIWVGYETGFRPGDLRELKWQSIDFASKKITICQHKTSKVHTSIFSQDSHDWLKKLQKYNEKNVFPLCKWGVRRWEGFLYERAEKLGFSRISGQGIGTLRKSHATQVDAERGIAAAAESLGHVSGVAIARNHYVDAREKTGFLPRGPGLASVG